MTAGVSRQLPGATPARASGARRIGIAVLGLATVALGLFLLIHPYSAAGALALFVGVALVVGGVLEITGAWNGPQRWPWVILGAGLVVVGLLAVFWPHITLRALALLVGLTLIFHGTFRVGLAIIVRDEIPHWGWLAAAGVVNALIGFLALAWPEVTVLLLSVMFGAQLMIFGVLLTVGAFLPTGGRAGPQPEM